MENASNALLMAAGVLISVILISLGTWLFTAFGGYSKTINDRLSQTQIEEFNAQFTKYETTQGDETTYCTAYDIVSVINLARNANEKYEEYKGLIVRPTNATNENNAYIYVNVPDNKINETTVNEKRTSIYTTLNDYIQQNIKTDGSCEKFNCTVIVSNQTKLVKSIQFTKQP